jgi:hypothetical protein
VEEKVSKDIRNCQICFLSNDTCHSSGSKLRHRIGFLGEVIWKPFDSRFSELKDRMAKHQIWFDREMAISDQQLLTQHYEDFLTFLRSGEQPDEKEKTKAIAEQERLAGKALTRVTVPNTNLQYSAGS